MDSTRTVSRIKRRLRGVSQARGYQLRIPVVRLQRSFAPDEVEAIRSVAEFTMTPPQRIVALRDAIEYITAARIPGAIVECGVWRGGSMMAAANELQRLGATDRELWLYDTFSGMTAPTPEDSTVDGHDGRVWFDAERARPEAGTNGVTGIPLSEVRANVQSTGYPAHRMHFVEGPVEQTLTGQRPESIALLRLDTDFYESTKAELAHLYPLLQPGGVLIIDDYGYWNGARLAVDEYFADHAVMLHRVDEAARMLVKPAFVAA